MAAPTDAFDRVLDRIRDESGYSYTPFVDTYHLMFAGLTKGPELENLLANARGRGIALHTSHQGDASVRGQVIQLRGEIGRTNAAFERELAKAVGVNPEIADALAASKPASDAALAEAAGKVREIDAALRKSGPERVRIATTFQTQPLYEQYRDKEGNFQTNARPDKIERYAVTARITLEVRDLAALEPAYAAVVAAKPESISPVNFNLEPDNAAKTWLQTEAVKDAARRARQAAEAAGARLGTVKVIDPSGRACQTDVLAGWPGYASNPEQRSDVQYSARAMDMPAPAPPASIMMSGSRAESQQVQVSLQPPQLPLTDDACVVYGLGPG